jgi:hypothetical protein
MTGAKREELSSGVSPDVYTPRLVTKFNIVVIGVPELVEGFSALLLKQRG